MIQPRRCQAERSVVISTSLRYCCLHLRPGRKHRSHGTRGGGGVAGGGEGGGGAPGGADLLSSDSRLDRSKLSVSVRCQKPVSTRYRRKRSASGATRSCFTGRVRRSTSSRGPAAALPVLPPPPPPLAPSPPPSRPPALTVSLISELKGLAQHTQPRTCQRRALICRDTLGRTGRAPGALGVALLGRLAVDPRDHVAHLQLEPVRLEPLAHLQDPPVLLALAAKHLPARRSESSSRADSAALPPSRPPSTSWPAYVD